jgi:exosome complex component RRP41
VKIVKERVKTVVKTDEKLIVKGKRMDGRKLLELRPIKMDIDAVSRADGSAQASFGNTRAIAAVYGPRRLFPRFMQESDTGILRCRYNMAPFSVDERKRPGKSRRGVEISKVMRHAFEPSVFLEDFPKVTIDIFVEVIQADGSTRVTGINAASIAMVVAGIPMQDLITACSVGKVDGELVVDLNGIEDNNSDADLSFAMMPTKGLITLLQMDGRLTKDEVIKLLGIATENCKKIYEMQREVILKKYENVDEGD